MDQVAAKKSIFRKRRDWGSDVIVFNVLGYITLFVMAFLCILPFYLIIVSSFTAENYIIRNGYSMYIPEFSLEGYEIVLGNPAVIGRAYLNTIGVTAIGTAIALWITTMTGYVLQRQDFPWRNKFSFFFFFTMLFNGGLVPWYILCVSYLGFTNRYYALVLPLLFNVWNMIIAKSFMRGIPDAITESAKIDGANDFTIYYRLILPLSVPLLATIGLFTALMYWNDWYHNMLFIREEERYMLQYYLQRVLGSVEALRRVAERSGHEVPQLPMESMKMAMTVVTTGPIILLYPFLQRYFVKGLTIGAVKG